MKEMYAAFCMCTCAKKTSFLGKDDLTIVKWRKVNIRLRATLPNHIPACRSELTHRWGGKYFSLIVGEKHFLTEGGDKHFFTDKRGDKHFMFEMVMMMLMVGGGRM